MFKFQTNSVSGKRAFNRELKRILEEYEKTIKKYEALRRGDLFLKKVRVKKHHVRAYDVQAHNRFIAIRVK